MKNGGVDAAFSDAILAPDAALSGSRKQQRGGGGRAVRPVPPLPGDVVVEGANGARGRVANRLGGTSGSGLASSGYRQIGPVRTTDI